MKLQILLLTTFLLVNTIKCEDEDLLASAQTELKKLSAKVEETPSESKSKDGDTLKPSSSNDYALQYNQPAKDGPALNLEVGVSSAEQYGGQQPYAAAGQQYGGQPQVTVYRNVPAAGYAQPQQAYGQQNQAEQIYPQQSYSQQNAEDSYAPQQQPQQAYGQAPEAPSGYEVQTIKSSTRTFMPIVYSANSPPSSSNEYDQAVRGQPGGSYAQEQSYAPSSEGQSYGQGESYQSPSAGAGYSDGRQEQQPGYAAAPQEAAPGYGQGQSDSGYTGPQAHLLLIEEQKSDYEPPKQEYANGYQAQPQVSNYRQQVQGQQGYGDNYGGQQTSYAAPAPQSAYEGQAYFRPNDYNRPLTYGNSAKAQYENAGQANYASEGQAYGRTKEEAPNGYAYNSDAYADNYGGQPYGRGNGNVGGGNGGNSYESPADSYEGANVGYGSKLVSKYGEGSSEYNQAQPELQYGGFQPLLKGLNNDFGGGKLEGYGAGGYADSGSGAGSGQYLNRENVGRGNYGGGNAPYRGGNAPYRGESDDSVEPGYGGGNGATYGGAVLVNDDGYGGGGDYGEGEEKENYVVAPVGGNYGSQKAGYGGEERAPYGGDARPYKPVYRAPPAERPSAYGKGEEISGFIRDYQKFAAESGNNEYNNDNYGKDEGEGESQEAESDDNKLPADCYPWNCNPWYAVSPNSPYNSVGSTYKGSSLPPGASYNPRDVGLDDGIVASLGLEGGYGGGAYAAPVDVPVYAGSGSYPSLSLGSQLSGSYGTPIRKFPYSATGLGYNSQYGYKAAASEVSHQSVSGPKPGPVLNLLSSFRGIRSLVNYLAGGISG